MKRRIIAGIVLLCVISVYLLPVVKAADDVYFTGINNTLLPLNDQTMPKYIGGLLYLPYTLFSFSELGVISIASGDKNLILLYSGSRRLTFDVDRSTIFDQNWEQYYQYSAKASNGTVYLPANFVCDFFDLTVEVISADPAPVVRVKIASNHINNPTFIGLNKETMQQYYDAFTNTSTSAPPEASVSPVPAPTYENVSVFLSFFDLSSDSLETLLDTFDSTGYKACFFVTIPDIADNAALLRRAAGSGHTIGIWLNDGTYDEYLNAAGLLFEATKIRTQLVSSSYDKTDVSVAMAASNSLLYWRASRFYAKTSNYSLSGITGKLSTQTGRHDSLCFACSERASTVMRGLLSYLSQNEYSVPRTSETSIPSTTG